MSKFELVLGPLRQRIIRGRHVILPATTTCPDTPIAQVFSHFGATREDAYAALFAAAPDLYDACQLALALLQVRMESGAGSFDFDVRDQMRAAIAKADHLDNQT